MHVYISVHKQSPVRVRDDVSLCVCGCECHRVSLCVCVGVEGPLSHTSRCSCSTPSSSCPPTLSLLHVHFHRYLHLLTPWVCAIVEVTRYDSWRLGQSLLVYNTGRPQPPHINPFATTSLHYHSIHFLSPLSSTATVTIPFMSPHHLTPFISHP